MTLFDRWERELSHWKAQGRYRTLAAPAGVDFASNDYLGYCGCRSQLNRSASAHRGERLAQLRSGTASRLLRGQHPIWPEVEAQLAAWHGAEAALIFANGYTANEGLLSTIIGPEDWVASDQFNHASIIDGLRLAKAERFIFRHQDTSQLEEGLRIAARQRPAGRELFIVTEALFGMDGDETPLTVFAELAERYNAHLIVDEAHSTGCFGPAGSGLVDATGLRQHVLATIHTGGKALGVAGAYVCCSRKLVEWLINRCRHFIFTTALPPLVGEWWLDALRRVQVDDAGRQLLHGNASFFRAQLASHRVTLSTGAYIVPIIIGADTRATQAAERLQQQGWDVRAIRPPSVPTGTARLRIAIHADHDRETLAALASAIGDLRL